MLRGVLFGVSSQVPNRTEAANNTTDCNQLCRQPSSSGPAFKCTLWSYCDGPSSCVLSGDKAGSTLGAGQCLLQAVPALDAGFAETPSNVLKPVITAAGVNASSGAPSLLKSCTLFRCCQNSPQHLPRCLDDLPRSEARRDKALARCLECAAGY